MNTGKLFPAHGLQDAVVDKLRLRPLHGLQDLGHLLSRPEVVTLHGEPLAPGAFPGTAAPALFFFDSLHDSRILCTFANESQPSGEVSLPFGTLKADGENRNLYFPNPKTNDCQSHFSTRFGFLSSCSGLREISLCNLSLITLQRYENFLNYARKIKVIFHKIFTFLRKSLEIMGEFPIFASSKFTSGSKSQVSQPAIFMPVLYRNHTTVTASEGGNASGVLLVRLRQRVVRSFIYV